MILPDESLEQAYQHLLLHLPLELRVGRQRPKCVILDYRHQPGAHISVLRLSTLSGLTLVADGRRAERDISHVLVRV